MKNFNAQKAYPIAEQIALLWQANVPLERVYQGADNPNVRDSINEAQGCADEALTELSADLYHATGAAYREKGNINADVYQTFVEGYRTFDRARASLEVVDFDGLSAETAGKLRAALAALVSVAGVCDTVLNIYEGGGNRG